jgi:hypothetical protein
LNKKLNYNYETYYKKNPIIKGNYYPNINNTFDNNNNIRTSNFPPTYPIKSKKKGLFGYPLGLFKENDWKCPNCNNINFSFRNECNRCHLEKDKINLFKESKYKLVKKRQYSRSPDLQLSSKKSSHSSSNKSNSRSKSNSKKSNNSYSSKHEKKK